MPISFRYADNGIGVVLVASGRTTASDFIQVSNTLLAAVDRNKEVRYALVDLCDVSEFGISADEVRQVVAIVRKSTDFNPHAVVVAIAATQRVVLGLARMWELMVDWEGWKIRVCPSLQEAEAWVRDEISRQDRSNSAKRGTASGCV